MSQNALPRGPRRLLPRWFLVVALLAGAAAAGGGCVNGAGDRCYVEPARHEAARRLYARAGSLEIVARTLAEADWMPCEIEQTIYRLKKENGLD